MYIYRIKDDEDVYEIAREYGISPIKLATDNEITTKLMPRGRELVIIQPTRTYNVRSGDTLESISLRFKVDKEDLVRMNPELAGRERIYAGQLLTIKTSGGRMGVISTNGYFYRGCREDRLIRLMPYLTYVTVCSAIYKDGKISSLFSAESVTSLIKSTGRAPMVRVYLAEVPRGEARRDFISSITILAKSGGFAGVTVSDLSARCESRDEAAELVLAARKSLMESDLLFFAEGDSECDCSYMEYADAGIITYDKLHKEDIPDFETGEKSTFTAFADDCDSGRTFVEMPCFALAMGKYIDRGEAIRITDRRRAAIINDEEKKISVAAYGKGRKKEIIYENLENTRARLELISELGYMGISFDIGRICLSELMMVSETFSIVRHPMMGLS